MKLIAGNRYAIFARFKIERKDHDQALTRGGEERVVLRQTGGLKGRKICWRREIGMNGREFHNFMPVSSLSGQDRR
jgi:hypothetical protein